MTGRVIKTVGPRFVAKTVEGLVICSVRRTIKDRAEYKLSPVVVGDSVALELDPVTGSGDQHLSGVITEVHSRKTLFFKRKSGLRENKTQVIAANVDQMIVVASVATPPLRIKLIDRFVIAAFQGGMDPVVVVNKADLEHEIDLERLRRIYETVGINLLCTSVNTGQGIDEFGRKLVDKESILVGQSGSGKSSLINAIQPGVVLRTGEVSWKSGKGKHTTTAIELIPLDVGGYVVDTPGLRALGLISLDKKSIDQYFADLRSFSGECRFSDCRHRDEPNCAVKAAVERGEIFRERYESYLRILDDTEHP
jgi:ribosome biogenesis GTPase